MSFTLIQLLAFIGLAQSAQAGAVVPPNCAELDLRTTQPGIRCLTASGSEFSLAARRGEFEVWRDEASQLLWADRSGSPMTYTEAAAWCGSDASLDARAGLLPPEGTGTAWTVASREDFLAAEARGFREVMPRFNGRAFWTSTQYPQDGRFGYIFSGSLGVSTSVDIRDSADAVGHWTGRPLGVMARCVLAN